MGNESVWVIGFNKVTGEREVFTCCNKNNSKFYQGLYEADGFDVKILTNEQVDQMIEQNNTDRQ